MSLGYIDYCDGATVLRAAVARPPQCDNAPVVIVAHQWAGRGAIEHDIVKRLAGLGYVGVAIDLFGKDVVGSHGGDNTHLIKPWLEDRKSLVQRSVAALDFVRTLSGVDASRVAALGYCFGGLCVLDLARSGRGDLRGVVSLHGLLHSDPTFDGNDITTKISVHHGWDDPLAEPDQVLSFAQEMTQKRADWQFHAYGHVGHAFTNPTANKPERGLFYHKMADQRSWKGIVDFLSEVFD